MANGITIGGGQYRLGEVFAHIANQQQQMAIQQQAQQDQLAMERMRMAQAQRNADAENQYRYAALQQQAQESAAARQFQSQENAAGRASSLEMERMRQDYGSEERASQNQFQAEQAQLNRTQADELSKRKEFIDAQRFDIENQLRNKDLDQRQRNYLQDRKDRLDNESWIHEYKLKEFEQSASEHEARLENMRANTDIQRESMQGVKERRGWEHEDRQAEIQARKQKNSPEFIRAKRLTDARDRAQKQLDGWLKSDAGKIQAAKMTQDQYNAALHKGTMDFYQQLSGEEMPQAPMPQARPSAEELDTLTSARSQQYGTALNSKIPWYVSKGLGVVSSTPLLGPALGYAATRLGGGYLDRKGQEANEEIQRGLIAKGYTADEAQAETQSMVDAYNAKGGYSIYGN